MYVVATAGHVDHGKSTLVRALTGMEPDRWEQERQRGMTIDLGYAWTSLPGGRVVAFVDVPGHERFVPNMLAGVGPVPAALFVVAADGGWMPQSAEHLSALDALGVRHGLLVITRSDLADPAPAAAAALAELAATSLRGGGTDGGGTDGGGNDGGGNDGGGGAGTGGADGRVGGAGIDAGTVETVAVSAVTGAGLDDLRAALDRLLSRLPAPDLAAPVRLWVDRSFSVRGSGTVVTGTLGAGRIGAGDELEIGATGRTVRVRAVQSLGEPIGVANAVARVALNLRGVSRDQVRRGDALVTPGRFQATDEVDVRVVGDAVADLPAALMVHIGSAAVAVRVRPFGADTARLRLSRPLPLQLGDRLLLRDPGQHHIAGGATVLDVAPPPLRRRGAASARTVLLSTMDGQPDEHAELARRGMIRRRDLERMGIAVSVRPVAGTWLADPVHWAGLRRRLTEEVDAYAHSHPLEPGAPVDALRQALGLPDRALVTALVREPLVERHGRVTHGESVGVLPGPVAAAVDRVRTDLTTDPFAAPEAGRLAALGLGSRELAAAVRAGALLRIADGIVLLPDAVDRATDALAQLPQPFTLSQARQAWGTTRRVAVPLLELLDSRRVTRRLPDDRRVIDRPAGKPVAGRPGGTG